MSFHKPALLLLSCLTLHAPSFALAQDAGSDFYFTGALGATFPSDFEAESGEGMFGPQTIDDEFEPTAIALRGGVGYQIAPTVRAEAEIALRRFDFSDEFDSSFLPVTLDSTGTTQTISFMINGLYDLNTVVPDYNFYVGAGLGLARVDIDYRRGDASPDFQLVEGDYTAFAAQLRVGAERQLSNGAILFADYTYLNIAEADFDGFNTGIGDTEQSFSAMTSQDVSIGVRFSL